MKEENIIFLYQVKKRTEFGIRYYYLYATTDIENYLINKGIKYVRYTKDTALNKQAKRIKELFKENKQLKEKINTYENPEDLTLMFMYCDEKAKDKLKGVQEERDYLFNKQSIENKYLALENKQLKNKWNELKKWLEKREFNSDYESYLIENYTTYTEILSKINELENLSKGENI